MAFNRTNPDGTPHADLAVLKGLVLDPTIGTKEILDLLNDPALNTGGEVSTNRSFSGFDLLEACASKPSEYALVVNSALSILLVETLTSLKEDAISARFRNELMGLFSQAKAPTIRAAIIAEATGAQSIAEVNFGDDTVISKQDWFAGRDS